MTEVIQAKIERVYIPKVSKEVLTERAKKVRAVVEFGRKKHFIQEQNIFTTAYTWEPKKAGKANGLVPLQDVKTYHTWTYYGFFKPTIAECLAQIPDEIFDQVVAFEIIRGPESADDFNEDKEAFNAGHHVAVTRYYGKA